MGGLIGGITDMVGLTDNKGAKRAAKQAAKSSDFAMEMARESVDFQREQYSDWKNVYGDFQANLGEYYKSLTPERTIAMGLQNTQKEYQAAIRDIGATAAQRGIAGSGLETGALVGARLDNAKQRATVRTMAPTQVAQEKTSFLSLGLGQGVPMMQSIGNAYGSGSSAGANIAGSYIGAYTGLKVQGMKNMNEVNNNMMTMGGFLGGG